MLKYVRIVEAMTRGLGLASMYLLLVVLGVLMFPVFARGGDISTIWALEAAQFAVGAYYILGAGYSLQQGAHVRMDFLYANWKPRTKAIVDSITSFFVLFYLVVMILGGWDSCAYAVVSKQINHTVWAPYMAPIKIAMLVGMFFMFLQMTAEFVKSLMIALKRPLELPDAEAEEEKLYEGRATRKEYWKTFMTGYLNQQYPSADVDYEPGMAAIRSAYDKPVFTFEVGQYEVLPDFDELEDFRGVTRPDNLALIRDRVREHGFAEGWKRRVEATGELSLLCYREEAEAALRTGSLSGISLLGLQDFPGQGTALVGMLNSHLQAKPFPFAQPERFRAFFAGQLPLALLPRYTYEAGETLTVPVRFANYGKTDLNGALIYELSDGMTAATGFLPPVCAAQGGLTDLGTIRISLAGFSTPKRLELHLWFGGCENSYPVWVYPATKPICPVNVHEARTLDDAALSVLNAGGTVYLSPDSTTEALPTSIKAQFSTDFWSVGTFGGQTGAMGQLIDTSHPIFTQFPTEFHTNWQWWPMATQRAIVLPENIPAIVTELDCYAYLRPMAQLFECRCGGGRLLVSSFGLQHLQQYPEARALQAAIYAYLATGSYVSTSELSVDLIRRIVR